VVPPEIAEANAIEDKLKFAANNGAYLAISVPPGRESEARIELLVHPCLLARYDRIEVLANLAADIGRSDKVRGRGADRTDRDPQGGEEKRRGQRRAVTGAPTFCRLSAWGHSVPSSPSKALAGQHVRLPPARRMHPLHFGVDS
jgi:hypothetical protein